MYFLTDLGRTSWCARMAGQRAADEFRARSERLAKAASLVVLDLGQTDSENLAITQLGSLEPFATLSRFVTLEAEVRNFGRNARPHQLVELFVDGRRTGEEYVDVDTQGRATVSFPYRFDTSGSHAVELRLPVTADSLDIDNHRWLALDVKEQLRVLCVNGKPGSSGSGGATEYLAVALRARPASTRAQPGPGRRRSGKRSAGDRPGTATIACCWPTWHSSLPTKPACSNPIWSAAAG